MPFPISAPNKQYQAILNVLSIAMLPVIKAANVVNDHGPTGLPYKVT